MQSHSMSGRVASMVYRAAAEREAATSLTASYATRSASTVATPRPCTDHSGHVPVPTRGTSKPALHQWKVVAAQQRRQERAEVRVADGPRVALEDVPEERAARGGLEGRRPRRELLHAARVGPPVAGRAVVLLAGPEELGRHVGDRAAEAAHPGRLLGAAPLREARARGPPWLRPSVGAVWAISPSLSW